MTDPIKLAEELLLDANLIVELFAKLKANIQQARQVLENDPKAPIADQITMAQAKLELIQREASAADDEFDKALAATQA